MVVFVVVTTPMLTCPDDFSWGFPTPILFDGCQFNVEDEMKWPDFQVRI